MEGQDVRGYRPSFVQETPLVAVRSLGYARKGYKKGINAIKELLKKLSAKDIITHNETGYHYNPEIIKDDK